MRQNQDAPNFVFEQRDGAYRDALHCTESAARLQKGKVHCARPDATCPSGPRLWVAEVGEHSWKVRARRPHAGVVSDSSFSARTKAFSTEFHT